MDEDRVKRNEKWREENKELKILVKPIRELDVPLYQRMGQEYVEKVNEHEKEIK